MEAIRKTSKKWSLKLKVVTVLFVLTGVLAFLWSLKYTGNAKNTFANLHFSEKLKHPECVINAGFYKEAFELKLTTSDVGTTIYYTTDGSEPSLSSIRYSKPIIIINRSDERNLLSAIPTSPRWKPPIGNVFKGTILRAITVDVKNNKSSELVRSFFVDEQPLVRYTIPIISLTVNEKDLFGYNKGIYVLGKSYTDKDNYIRKNIPLELPWWEYPSNYLQRGENAERPAHLEFFEPNGQLGFESNIGLRINGNATRGFAQKSLRVCFREKYGQEVLNYELFSSNPVNKFNSFILRNSGNDWDKTMFRDAFMQSLMNHTHLDIQDYRPSIVFINGEYWGIHNIRERFDEHYLANKYHLNADSVTILELSGKLVKGEKSEEESFQKLLDFVQSNDLANQKNYSFVCSQIDIESFIDFMIANIYFCNSDWPNNNVKFWKYNAENVSDSLFPADGRWRWMLYDTDWGFGYNSLSTPQNNLLTKATKVGSVGILFGACLKNQQFVNVFLDSFQQHLNTTFNSDLVVNKINQMQGEIAPAMPEHIARWRAIQSYSDWLNNVEVLRQFAKQRPQFQVSQLNVFFNLKGAQQITLKK